MLHAIAAIIGLILIASIIYSFFKGKGGGDVDGRDPGPPGSW
jgi:hypothetical protein